MEENKKTERKRKRFAARLKSAKGVTCTDIPGPNIVLCNAGQATNLEKDYIHKLIEDISTDIQLLKFIAKKGESHSFVVFHSTEHAALFFNTHNNKAKADDKGTPLYMNYVENVPSTEIICQHEDPKGLMLINDFITAEEERQFIKLFDWTPDIDLSTLKNRQVKHYGYEFRYGTNDVDLNNPLPQKIPEDCDILWERLRDLGLELGEPDQLTVNKYSAGQGIPSHVDKHSPFGDTILSLSLQSPVVMDWKHHSGKYVPIPVQERSLLIMQDEARYDWLHGIHPRTFDPVIQHRMYTSENYSKPVKVITSDTVPRGTRISLTFRWTRSGPCKCSYKMLCDSYKKTTTDDLDDGLASNLEELHVHQVYEQIAGHFSTTRHKPWPRVVEFMQRVKPGDIALDLGAGNGKNVLNRGDILQIAGERSSGLLAECKEHTRGIGRADCVRLDLLHAGLRDGCADTVICIAVIHHFSTRIRRLQAISTIHRLLRTDGRAFITVWAKDQTRSNYLCKSKIPSEEFQLTVGGLNLPVHENRTQFQHKDLLVPWKLRKVGDKKITEKPDDTLLRFYHVFEDGELDGLCRDIGFVVEDSFYEEGNWCVVCYKV